MVFQSPLFSNELIEGDYSFPINLPSSRINNQLLNFANIPANSDAIQDFDCDIFIGGIFLLSGKLVVSQPGTSGFQVYILSSSGAFKKIIEEKKINELSLETVSNINGTYGSISAYVNSNAILTKTFPDVNANYPRVINEGLFDGIMKGSAHGEIIDQSFVSLNETNGSATPTMIAFPGTALAFPYLFHIINKIASENNYTISGNFSTDSEIKSLVIFNNFSLAIKSNLGFEPPYGPPISTSDADTIDLKNHVPAMLIEDFINSIKKKFFLAVIIDTKGKNIEFASLKSIITSTDYVDDTTKTDPEFTIYKNNYNGITLTDEVDSNDELLSENFNAIEGEKIAADVDNYSDLSALAAPEEGEVRLVKNLNKYFKYIRYWRNDISAYADSWDFFCYANLVNNTNRSLDNYTINSQVVSVSALPSASGETLGSIRFVEELNQYWIVKQYSNSDQYWAYFSDNLYDKKIDNGVEEIKTKATTLGMSIIKLYTITAYREYLLPHARVRANSTVFADGANDCGLRLLFYRGLQFDGGGVGKYPMASSDVYDILGNQIGNYSLSWNTEFGIYEKWAKEWLAFLKSTIEIEFFIDFTITDILTLDWKKKRRIRDTNYLIKQIDVEFPITGPVKARYMKC